jgi:Ni,Fe-hydrogenase III large subunit
MDSEELHEVGVGPIHAGIIEPGHFRFICKGEQILHLEIQLGYQHRGIEKLFLEKNNLLHRVILAESIAGDSTVGHTSAFANIWESLCGYEPDEEIKFVRTIALELERIAIHTGDLSAICGDVAYQLGSSVFSRLRTPIINFFQAWCGNRLAKGLIRPAVNNYIFTEELKNSLLKILDEFEPDFNDMIKKLFHNPGCLLRFEKTGVVSYDQALDIGTVGMTAKASGLNRDIRSSHPFYLYKDFEHQPVIKHHGDVFSRTQIRREEILQSISYIRNLLEKIPSHQPSKEIKLKPAGNAFTISLVEGWRGEICHCAVTNEPGELIIYKVKDPSFHNWLALALAVRRNEISDFPICNKSFNLSYSGVDL